MQYFSRLIVTAAILLSPLMASGDTEIIKAQGQGVASTSDRSNTQAKLMSMRAARIDAQRKLLEEIEGVQLTALSTVKDLMLTNDVIGTRVKGMLKGAFEVSSNATKDGGDWVSTIEMALCLTSDSAQCRGQINLTTLAKPYLEVTPEKDLYSAQDLNATINTTDSVSTIEEQPPYTGLVLDATKFKVMDANFWSCNWLYWVWIRNLVFICCCNIWWTSLVNFRCCFPCYNYLKFDYYA